jgi:hypothetical protein
MIELTLGFTPRWYEGETCFASEADRAAAWQAHRERLSRGKASNPGRRCWGWWRYEAEVARPADQREALLFVARRGDLDAREIAALKQRLADAEARIGTNADFGTASEAAAFYRRVLALSVSPEDGERQHDESREENDASEDPANTRLSEERHVPTVAPKGPTE